MRGRRSEAAVIEGLVIELRLGMESVDRQNRRNAQLLEFLADLYGGKPPRGPATIIQFPSLDAA